MISKRCLAHLRDLVGAAGPSRRAQPIACRAMATLTDHPAESAPSGDGSISSGISSPFDKAQVLTTLYSFPQLEPLRFAYYPSNHLYLPLRRDILHRAVVFEGDAARQGTASTKWRDDVHGSHKKHHQQKGTGRARAGDKQSPIFRGGGVVFGPKPRDFSTGLNRKVYDLAWRTALSYRYRRGELVVVDQIRNPRSTQRQYLVDLFNKNGWGNADRRSLLVTVDKSGKEALFEGMEDMGRHGSILEAWDVDVKNLLEKGRIIIEKRALDRMLLDHSSDLAGQMPIVSSNLPELVLP